MNDFQSISELSGKHCFIIGTPNSLMRSIVLLLVDSGCHVLLGINESNQEDIFTANSIINELWSMGHKGEVLEINFDKVNNFSVNHPEIQQLIPNIEILIRI